MEIKDFVKTTLKELSEAISESKNELDKKVILTNTSLRLKNGAEYGFIDFDLAVEAKDTKKTGGKGGIRITVVEASLGKDSETTASSVSRVKFTVEADF